MEDFCKYSGINRTFFLICCMFWTSSAAEGNTISAVVGRKVILHCNRQQVNKSNSTLVQLTWKMNGGNLFTFSPQRPLHIHEEALSLNVNMSLSESQLYALVIERVQRSHTGNYTCETNMIEGVWEQKWELIITEGEEAAKLVIAVAAIVPCLCCLIFIIALIILKRIYKQHAGTRVCSPAAGMQEQTEDIYENCLESDVS